MKFLLCPAKYKVADVKLDNVFVNYGEGDIRFSDVQLGDLGGTYPVDSKYAKEGTPVGAPMWSSPEVIMETPWNTATDIWSFGTVVSSDHDLRTDAGADPACPTCSSLALSMVGTSISSVLARYRAAMRNTDWRSSSGSSNTLGHSRPNMRRLRAQRPPQRYYTSCMRSHNHKQHRSPRQRRGRSARRTRDLLER